MFFKRTQNEDKKTEAKKKDTPQPQSEHKALTPSELRRTVSPSSLGFKTTDELEPISGLIGQERALRAIEFGADMRSHDFNLFVLGPPAAGKSTAVRSYLEKKAAGAPVAPDWVYVNNFEDPNRPKAIKLPNGRARILARSMISTIDELRNSVPAIFEGDDYTARRRSIEDEFRSGQEEAFEELNKKALAQNIAILRTPTGFAMAPMHEGKVVKPEVFNQLPDDMQKSVVAKIEALQAELEKIVARLPKTDKERRSRISALNEEVAKVVVQEALDDVKAANTDIPEVAAYLEAAGNDLVRNIALFLASGEEEQQLVKQPADTSRDPRFRRYMINVVVGDGPASNGAPIIEDLNPTYGNLIGRVEHVAQMGALLTDFLLIKGGSLHRANGGYLMLDARKLLLSPFAYEALKRTLKSCCISIEQPSEMSGLVSTQTLDPEPIPLDVKVILFGDRQLYYMLSEADPDFDGLFKVQADFDDTIDWSDENNQAYARVIASIARRYTLKPLESDAVARVIEEGARMADDREKLSIQIGRISDLVREADYWAGKSGRSRTTRADVSRAVDEHIQRADRLRDRSQETINREIIIIDTDGEKVGQINGLSVLQLGGFSFGKPSRITARVRMGQGRVTDIEREVKLGGPLHSKGVMILWGFLAGRFAQDIPLAMAATLVFEQSYGGVDGDSASSTELYALLSALSEAPIRQSLAVTGSVNQWGEVQAIGGANEKIEGYFDICKKRGLTGTQGVLIPRSNVQHLMLREDVVEAVKAGKFFVYPVAHVDEGIEILTGIKAGKRLSDNTFEVGTINHRVEARLREFAEHAKKFGRGSTGDSKDNGSSQE